MLYNIYDGERTNVVSIIYENKIYRDNNNNIQKT